MERVLDQVLSEYAEKEPEIVFEWHDNETTAKGWVVLNSLRNGAAGGGTRMRKGLTKDEVVALSKVMEIKFSVAGPPIGGAKSGIDFDPRDPRKDEVIKRWFEAVIPLLKNYYGTGGDLNIDELKDVIPVTQSLGLLHPQEGVVNGHIKPSPENKAKIIDQLRKGVSKIVTDKNYAPDSSKKYAIADMITGFGVAYSIIHFYDIFKDIDVKNKRIIIQGWGNVASAAGYYLSKAGAKIVGIIDINGGLIVPDGMGFHEVENLFISKINNTLSCDTEDFDTSNNKIWDVPCDVFIPGAASRLVKRDQVDRMLNNGIEVIACGANVPFSDDKVFFGETARYVDKRISLIPDFVANCGMARVFAYLMQENARVEDESIFSDVSKVIGDYLRELYIDDKTYTRLSERSLRKSIDNILKKDITKV